MAVFSAVEGNWKSLGLAITRVQTTTGEHICTFARMTRTHAEAESHLLGSTRVRTHDSRTQNSFLAHSSQFPSEGITSASCVFSSHYRDA